MQLVRFGVFTVDLTTAELRKQGTLLRLQDQPFQILAALLERPGEVVTREELIGRLWADGTVVDYDRGLNAAVTRLRQVLNDSAETPRYVETVARRGYRFIAPVAHDAIPVVVPPESPKAAPRWPWAVAALGVVAGLVLWRAYPAKSELVSTNEPVAVVPLTTEPGAETDVSFSPDGNQIAYAWKAPGADLQYIYLRQVGLGDPVRLTKGSAGEYSPVWSRDGRYIAFLRPLTADRLTLMLAPVLGTGPERKLIELPSVSNWQIKFRGLSRSLDWTPDSRYLIVTAYREGSNRMGAFPSSGLLRVNVETGERRWIHEPPGKLSDGVADSPSISPDGRSLAFVRASSAMTRELHVQPLGPDAEPAGPAVALKTNRPCFHPHWTNDGKAIVFASFQSWLYRIAARPDATADALQAAATGVRMPAVSSDGRVAWTREFRDTNVWAVDMASGTSHQVIGSTTADRTAQYSPDGRRIALQSWRSGTPQIWVCDSDGTRCAQMTEMKGDTGSPSWSPDGSQIAFDSQDGQGRYDVYIVSAAGGKPRRLTNHSTDSIGPSWSRDGRLVYFHSPGKGRMQIWKVPAAGGPEVLVPSGGGISPKQSIDSQFLFYTRLTDIGTKTKLELFRVSQDGSGETKLIDDLMARAYAVTRDHLYYFRAEGASGASLRQYTLANGVDRVIARIPKPVDSGLSVSPDGKTALFTQVDSEGSDIVMVKSFR